MSTDTKNEKQTVYADPLKAAIEATPRQVSIRNTAAQFLGVPPERACDLLRNVWQTSKGQPPLSDAEMFVGMSMIARFGLDPIAKEIYVTRTSKGLVTIIGIDGWIKILDRTEGYDGFEQELHFDDDQLDWVETSIYSTKRGRPIRYRAFAHEYAKIAGIVAKTIPWHMLRLFSLRHAARLFTPIGGSVVTEEEARWMDAYAETPADDRHRTNSLREKVSAAAKEFEPLPQPDVEGAAEPTAPEATPPAETKTPSDAEMMAYDQLDEAIREVRSDTEFAGMRAWIRKQQVSEEFRDELRKRCDAAERLFVNKGQRELV